MKVKILFLTLLISLSAYCESPYTIPSHDYIDKGVVYEVTPLTPVKSQDGIGLCYGFSSTSLLENYRCRELNLDCSDPHQFLSSLDVTSYYEKKSLREGGLAANLLSNLQRSNKKIAREECIKFSTLVHQLSGNSSSGDLSERNGWRFLVNKWNEYKGIGEGVKRSDCISCLADSIKMSLVNIETPVEQIKSAFDNAKSLEEFLYKEEHISQRYFCV